MTDPVKQLAAVVAKWEHKSQAVSDYAHHCEPENGTDIVDAVTKAINDFIEELQPILSELQRAQGRLSEEVRKLHVYTRSEIDKLDYSDGIGLLSQDHVYELLSAPTPAEKLELKYVTEDAHGFKHETWGLTEPTREQYRAEFAAECERFHNQGHKCATCGRTAPATTATPEETK